MGNHPPQWAREATDDDAGGVLCHLADDVGLCQIELVGQAHAVEADRTEHGQRIQKAVGRPLVKLLEQFFIKAGFFGRTRNQLAVVKRDTKAERKFLADFPTARTILTANGDNQIVIHNAPSLPVRIIHFA